MTWNVWHQRMPFSVNEVWHSNLVTLGQVQGRDAAEAIEQAKKTFGTNCVVVREAR